MQTSREFSLDSRVIFYLLMGLSFSLLIVLISSMLFTRDGDFRIFFAAGKNLLNAEPLYSLSRDGASCFKYPPWIAPFFAPFAVFSIDVAGPLWRGVLIICAAYIVFWTVQSFSSLRASLVAIGLFWGIWLNNVVMGQTSILLLACALYGFNQLLLKNRKGMSLLLIALSVKVFHLFSLIAVKKEHVRLRDLFVFFGVISVLSVPAYLGYVSTGPFAFLNGYLENARSVDGQLGGGMYGLPVLWVKLLSLPVESTFYRTVGFLPSLLLAVGIFLRAKQTESSEKDLFALALGLSGVIHPLCFSYGFIWAYPLAVMILTKLPVSNMSGKRQRLIAGMYFVGFFCFVFLDSNFSKFLGISIFSGYPIKSIGVMILGFAFSISSSSSSRDCLRC